MQSGLLNIADKLSVCKRANMFINMVVVVCVGLFFAACDVHEFPSVEASDEADAVDVQLDLTFDSNLPLYQEVTTSGRSSGYAMSYIIEAYRANDDGTYSQSPDKVATFEKEDLTDLNQTVMMKLVPGDYRIIAWANYDDEQDEDHMSMYYNTSNLQDVSINDAKATSGNTDMADAFRAVTYITVDGRRAGIYEIEMTRPLAKFEIITTDVEIFADMMKTKSRADVRKEIERGNYTILIAYSGFTPSTYNLVENFTSDSRLDLSFSGGITMLSDEEALLGFDYVFMNDTGGNVTLTVTVYDSDGTKLASSGVITVPLMQGQLTVVKGNFLSADIDNGGLGINPSFEGPDHNIRV